MTDWFDASTCTCILFPSTFALLLYFFQFGHPKQYSPLFGTFRLRKDLFLFVNVLVVVSCSFLFTPTTVFASTIGVFVVCIFVVGVGILLFRIVVVFVIVVGGSLFRGRSLSLCRSSRHGSKLHHQLKAWRHGTTGTLHSLNGGPDLSLLGHASYQISRRIGFAGWSFLGIVLFPERGIWWNPSLGGLLFGGLFGDGRLAGLPVDLLFDLHGGGFLGLGQSAAGSCGGGSLGASSGDGSIGNGRLFGGTSGSLGGSVVVLFARQGLGLLLSSVGDNIVYIESIRIFIQYQDQVSEGDHNRILR